MTPIPIRIEDAGAHVGQAVEIRGWLYHARSSGKIHFLQVRDGSGVMQCVMARQDVPAEAFAAAGTLAQESSVAVRGTVRADARAPGGYELSVAGLDVIQEAAPYPITPKEHGVEFLMDHRHLWLRSRRQHALMRIRAEVIRWDELLAIGSWPKAKETGKLRVEGKEYEVQDGDVLEIRFNV